MNDDLSGGAGSMMMMNDDGPTGVKPTRYEHSRVENGRRQRWQPNRPMPYL